ncbi:hypothetical protein ACHAWC_005770 [Mediolabrus comicus]
MKKMNTMASLLLLSAAVLLTSTTNAAPSSSSRIYYNDTLGEGSTHDLTTDINHNIVVSSGVTLTLTSDATITAPSSVDNGESAIRIEDAIFVGVNGTIRGGANFGGVGVTLTTTRNSNTPATALFDTAIRVYGGDASRNETTQGGDAIQILQSGSVATFLGGQIVAGKGCNKEICGVVDGYALKVIQGRAVIKGGVFQGEFYNLQGSIQIYGCVTFHDKDDENDDGRSRIKGVLSDGSVINVVYVGDDEPEIIYDELVCPPPDATEAAASASDTSSSVGRATASLVPARSIASLGLFSVILLNVIMPVWL